MDHWMMQSNASAFLEAGRLAEGAIRTSQVMMAFPAIVCFAFSAELGIKLILLRERKKSWGHDLAKLLLMMSHERIAEIMDRTGVSDEEFASGLSLAKLAFPEWRYGHAFAGERMVNVGFLQKLAEAVESVSTTMPKLPRGHG